MARAIFVVGETGRGKSYSLRNLEPKETVIINVAGKDLPFPGYMKNYNKKDGTLVHIMDPLKVASVIIKIGTTPENNHIKNLIIDDFQYLMSDQYMEKAHEKGFDKFVILAKNMYDLLSPKVLPKLRDDLTIAILTHGELKTDGQIRAKTIGKMLDEKVTLDGLVTVALHCVLEEFSPGKIEYKFLTNTDGLYGAKSPKGMFSNMTIDNDLAYVFKRMKEYYEDGIVE
jgi:hypothetical protein